MALATQCPHCLTTFRVAADQLKLRGGIVRCGSCQSIFDGNAHLIDLDKPAAPPAAPAPVPVPTPAGSDRVAGSDTVAGSGHVADPDRTASSHSAAVPNNVAAPDRTISSDSAAVPEEDAPPVYTLDFGQSFEPLGILPNVAAPTPEAAPATPAPRARVWRTGASMAAPAGADETMPAATPAARHDVPATPQPDTAAYGAPTAPYDVPPAANAYAQAGRVAPRLEPLAGPRAGAPDADTDADANADADADDGAGADASATLPDSAMDADAIAPAPTTGVPAATGPAPVPHSAPAPDTPYAPAGRIEPSFDLPVDEEIVALPLPDNEPEPAPPAPAVQSDTEAAPATVPRPASGADDDVPPAALPLRASAASESPEPAAPAVPPGVPGMPPVRSKAARASEARARRSKLTPTKIEPPKLRIAPDTDADEPEFVKRSRRLERTDRTRRLLMIGGAVVLLFALLAQVVVGWRNVLAQRYPGLEPVLRGGCAVLGCSVELPALADNLVIETGELTTLGPNTYALNTLLRNQSGLVLAWPSIELELTDAGDKPVLRRVLAPSDYLPPGTSVAKGFNPHSEQPVTLHFTLAGLQPSGYHTFVFYP